MTRLRGAAWAIGMWLVLVLLLGLEALSDGDSACFLDDGATMACPDGVW